MKLKLLIFLLILPMLTGCVMTKKQKAFMKETRVILNKVASQVENNSGFIQAMNPESAEAKQNLRNAQQIRQESAAHAEAKFPGLSVNWEAIKGVAGLVVNAATNSVTSPGGIAGGIASTVLGGVALWMRNRRKEEEDKRRDAERKADDLIAMRFWCRSKGPG